MTGLVLLMCVCGYLMFFTLDICLLSSLWWKFICGFRWLRANVAYGGFETLRQTERIRIRKSAVIIENVGVQDSRTYVCFANSSVGSDRHQIDLVSLNFPSN